MTFFKLKMETTFHNNLELEQPVKITLQSIKVIFTHFTRRITYDYENTLPIGNRDLRGYNNER